MDNLYLGTKQVEIWPDSVRLKMIEKSKFYTNESVYQFGFYDGYQSRNEKMQALIDALSVFVNKYNSVESGEHNLGIGLVNGDFFKAQEALKNALI